MQERMSEDMTKKAMLEALARRRAMRHEPNPAAEVSSMSAKVNRLQSSGKPLTK